MHFDYCTTACTNFVSLDEATFKDILEASNITFLLYQLTAVILDIKLCP
jgi:hypothetical protein